jgi:membrane protein required for colicin V production
MTVSNWNSLDWLLIAILLVSTIAGLRRGLVRTVLGLAGFLGGFLLAASEYARMGDHIVDLGWIKSPTTARLIAYVLIVAVVTMGTALVASLMHQTVRAVGLSFFNRVLGAGFGLLRGWVIGMALLMIPSTFAPQSTLLATSILSPCFFAVGHDVSFFVPQYLQLLTLKSGISVRQKIRSG